MVARRLVLALPIAAALLAGSAAAQTSLPDVRGARTILIWDRGTDAGRVLVAYNIERQDEEGFYAGSVNFVEADGTSAERTRSALVAIPPEAARGFLAALSALPVAAAPAGAAAEGAPAYALRVEMGEVEVEIRSTASGGARGPWRATVKDGTGEREMTVDSGAVLRALRILDPHLKRDWVEARRREAAGAR